MDSATSAWSLECSQAFLMIFRQAWWADARPELPLLIGVFCERLRHRLSAPRPSSQVGILLTTAVT